MHAVKTGFRLFARCGLARPFLATVVLWLSASAIHAQEGKLVQVVRAAGIEIGSTGVKAIVVDVKHTSEGPAATIVFSPKTINTAIIAGVTTTGRHSAAAIKDTAEAVERFYQIVQKDHQVDRRNIHVVASSGIPKAENRGDLIQAIKEKTGKRLQFLDVETEVRLSILGMVPAEHRFTALLFDVGGGNSKGGFLERAKDSTPGLAMFTVEYGSRSYSEHVGKTAKEAGAYGRACERMAGALLEQPLKAQAAKHPDLKKRDRVYLSGGAVWALATILYPEKIADNYVVLTTADFESFHRLLLREAGKVPLADLTKVTDPALLKQVKADLGRIGDTFSWEQLLAGVEVLRSAGRALELSGKKMYFVRDGFIAWIKAYAIVGADLDKVYNAPDWSKKERLFVLYALEDLYRETWMTQRVMSNQDLRRFKEQQRVLADQLRVRVRAVKMDDELIELLEDYLKFLDVANPFQAQLEARVKEYQTPILDIRQKAFGRIRNFNMMKSQEVAASAFESAARTASNPFSDGVDILASGLFSGLAAASRVQIAQELNQNKQLQQARDEIADYEKLKRPAFSKDLEKINQDLLVAVEVRRRLLVQEAQEVAWLLARRYGWKDAEVNFQPARPLREWLPHERPHDPFRSKVVANFTVLPRDSQEAEACLKAAKECMQAADKLVPSANVPVRDGIEVYNYYRAQLYGLAGYLANQVSAQEVGSAGFRNIRKGQLSAAATAVNAWKKYWQNEKQDRIGRGLVYHNMVLAYAYAGDFKTAFAVGKGVSKLPGQTIELPEFWYDCARISCCMNAPKDALVCFLRARSLGFKDLEKAQVSPDLTLLRNQRPDLFKDGSLNP